MGTQAAIAPDEYNFSDLDLICADVVDHQRIARPDCREHAPACGGKTEAAE
jgi:hypothetical protein